ncbi:MAG TPA: TonB-dependent receptor, partial [Bacteroidia bacterium]|nr:TonB-dependent receptor [Bacteroidia bacterium]
FPIKNIILIFLMIVFLQKKCVLAFLLALLSISVKAQTTAISGIIKDKETGQPVEDVVVTIEKTNNHTHSDANGAFTFIGLTPGIYEIDLNKLGYEKKQVEIITRENETIELALELLFNAKTLSTVAIETDRPVSAASSVFITQFDFENRPKNSAQDMLRLVPGLFIAQHAGGGKAEQIFIRGFDCDHGTDVATFVDGIPVNMPSHGHGQGYEDLHFLIPEIVKGMSVFKGPYSPQYGNFATGAAVQFNTLDTLEKNLFQYEAAFVPSISTLTSNRALTTLQLPDVSSKVTSYVAADILNSKGYFENNQHLNRFNLFSKTVFNINDKNKFSFSASGFGSSWNASGQIPERAVKSGLITRFGSIDNSEGGTTQRNNFNLVYHSTIGNGEFETQLYSSIYRFKLFSNFTFFLKDSINGDEIEQDDFRIIRGLNTRFTNSHKFRKLNCMFTLGASFRSDEIQNELWHVVKRERIENKEKASIHERSTAMYVNECIRFNNHFRVELGARYDYFIFDVDDLLPTDSIHQNYSGYNYQTLLSPKLNAIYTKSDQLQFFANSGMGFHSNDARSVVQEKKNHQLPRTWGAEVGLLTHIKKYMAISMALWWMDSENELVYIGDEGTTENKGCSRRTGLDLNIRSKLTSWLFADADLTISKANFIDTIFGKVKTIDFYVPLAPTITSTGGIRAKLKNGIEPSIRYRYMANRPANESNTIIAHGYTIFDASLNYKTRQFKIGLVVENIFNTKWNEAQFETESKLPLEKTAVDELNFTPGTPLSLKVIIGYMF